MADARLDIVIRAVNEASRELKKIQQDLGEVEKPAKKATGGLEAMKKGFKTLIATGAGLAAFGVMAKKAFDFSQEGATILQTRDSFDRLGVSIDAMRNASRGTIDDMTLMSATLTLAGGASEELQAHLMSNAPRLMEIAKAANAVNPALGDTAHMYQSIATGIKRASPMILDNLGIIVKVGEANERYAEQIGKTVDELTAEEKQIALLNATIEAGDRLIQQAGGSTASLTDEHVKLGVAWKNNMDDLKTYLGASGIGKLLNSYAETLMLLPAMRKEYGYLRTVYESFFNVIGGGNTIFDDYLEKQARIEKLTKLNATATTRYEDTQRALMLAQVGTGESMEHLMQAGQEYAQWADQAAKQELEQYRYALERAGESAEAAAKQIELISWATKQTFGADMAAAEETLAGLVRKAEDLQAAIAETDDKAEMGNLRQELRGVREEIDKATGAMKEMQARFILGLLESQLKATDMSAEAQAQILTMYAESLGLIDRTAAETSLAVTAILNDVTLTVDEKFARLAELATGFGDSVVEASGAASGGLLDIIAKADDAAQSLRNIGLSAEAAQIVLDRMHGKTIDMEINWIERNRPTTPGGAIIEGRPDQGWYAYGGVARGGASLVGERGPELVNLPAGANVMPAPVTHNITNNYNLSMSTRATSPTVRQDFAMMRAMG